MRPDATPLLTGDALDAPTATGAPTIPPADDPALAFRYRSAEPIDWEGTAVHPLYSEQLPTATAALTVTLLSATPPAGLTGVGIGLSMVDGHIDIDGRRLAGVDIWRDALERGITFDLTANSPGALFVLTPVWADTAGEPQSWSGNYGIVVERTDNDRTVLWCSMGEGPPHFADLVVEVRHTPLDPHPRPSAPGTGVVPSVSVPVARDGSGGERVPRPAAGGAIAITARPGQYGTGRDVDRGRPGVDSGAPEGYPCSLADLVLHSPYTDGADILIESLDGTDEFFDYSSLFDEPVPDPLPALAFSGPAILLTGPEQWYLRSAEEDADTDPAAAHGWADAPDRTGLVPVISGDDLPDYGPEPVREPSPGEPSVFPLPAAYFTAARAAHGDAEDDESAAADTIADGSLPPFPADDNATGSPDRLYDLGAARCAVGDDEQAARWWAEAADAGHLGAAYDLGALYYRHDEFDAAQRWWQVAAGRRHIRAMASLADLLEQRGAIPEARMWRTQAVAEEVIANAAQTTDSFAVPTAGR
ncbi:tetratricopeptide repeat protein [Nocardia grenadensis]|uniref:tetratricopeptide repeat protein n=1 Tax=Nocardia grenadensis TaxID=931537 RepID=UPI003D8AE9A4